MYILGINSAYHETAACLIKDGQLIAAVEEERFSRVKHGKPARVDNPDLIPTAAINYCLKEGGIGFSEVGYIGLSFFPKDRLKNINIDNFFKPGDWGSQEGEELFYRKLLKIPVLISELAGEAVEKKIHWIPHHLCHAASAFFVSPFSGAAILSIDGIGEISSTWLGGGEENKIEVLKEINYPNSIGFLWEKFSQFLGLGQYDASKVMGLASYGDWRKFYPQFQKLVKIYPDGNFSVDNSIMKFRLDDFGEIEELFGVKRINHPDERKISHEQIAAGLQKITNEVLLSLAHYLVKKSNSENLCLSGGVALNSVANYEIMKSGLFKNIYIQPAAHDAGTALGAAYYIWNQILGGKRGFVMEHAYWGPDYSEKEMESILIKEAVKYKKIDNIEERTAKLLTEGNIIGWFQGKMEWGPRALGNRSLLVDPRKAELKEILNARIKKREPFRPFAPSILEEDADQWFRIPTGCYSLSAEFMEFVFPVKKDKADKIPAVVHIDGTSRIHLVRKEINPKYHRLLAEFKKLTGVPLVLNTSFNENEPIVCSPQDAVNTFKRTKMDYLVLGDFLVEY